MNLLTRSLWSSGVVAVFIILALGSSSSETPVESTQYLGNGIYRQETRYVEDGVTSRSGPVIEGPKDGEGRWQGKVKTYNYPWEVETNTYNVQEFHAGKRHGFGGDYVKGELTRTYFYENGYLLATEDRKTDPQTNEEYWERVFYNAAGEPTGAPTRIPRPKDPRRLVDVVQSALAGTDDDLLLPATGPVWKLDPETIPELRDVYLEDQVIIPPVFADVALPTLRVSLVPDAIARRLQGQAPWFLSAMYARQVTPDELSSFFSALIEELNKQQNVQPAFFAGVFDEAMIAVSEQNARYGFIREIYKNVRTLEVSEASKSLALRRALLKRQRAGSGSTFAILQTDFPQALADWQAANARIEDVQYALDEIDRRLAAQPPLDPEDPLFWQKADERILAVLNQLNEEQFNFGTATRGPLVEYANLLRACDPLLRAAYTAYFAQAPLDRNALDWQVAEIYIATLMYAPDSEGLNYWIGEIAAGKGWTATTVAQSFFDQPGVQAHYPAGQSYELLIDALYRNIFGRAPDAEGKAYWLAELNSGRVARNAMIIALINGGWANPQAANDMARFRHRIEVGLFFAAQQAFRGIVFSALTPERQARLRALGDEVLAQVTADPATRDAALAAIPGLLETL